MAHRGYPGAGPPGNMANVRVRSITMGGGTQDKILDLYHDSKAHRYDILLIQETKSKLNEVANALAGIAHMVFEAHNPDNHIKGGVANTVINPDINPELVNTDRNFN